MLLFKFRYLTNYQSLSSPFCTTTEDSKPLELLSEQDEFSELSVELEQDESDIEITSKGEPLEETKLTGYVTYSKVIDVESLELGLKRTKSGSSPGLDGEVKADWNKSKEKIVKLHQELKSQKFRPSPTKRVQIPKADGGTRPLGIASQKDKIVQASLLNHLEKALEPVFLDSSMGFRPGRNCHNALRVVKRKWQNVTWLINIDIAKYFDTIHHPVMLELVKPYCDQATVELIRKFLKAGYVDIHNLADSCERSSVGTPQGSLISPILANIYLHQLDEFVQNSLLCEWNKGDERKYVSGYQARKYLTSDQLKQIAQLNIEGAEEALKAHKHNMWVKANKPSRDPHDPNFRRLYYIRYADDFVLGFSGTHQEAIEIKSRIMKFLEDKLKLKVNETKSKIYHAGDRGIKFLGFYLRYLPNKIVTDPKKEEEGVKQLKSTAINQVQLRIPVENLLERGIQRGWAKQRKNGTYRATSLRKIASLEDKEIVNRFSSIIRGVVNYYQPANQYSDLWQVVSLIRKACALTLADKHKLKTAAKAYKKWGPKLTVSDNIKSNEKTSLFYPETLKTTGNFNLGKAWITTYLLWNDPLQGSYKSLPKTSLVCQYPGCESTHNLEEHHINELKNLKKKGLTPYLKSLISKKRETVTLCREHHKVIHGKKK